jgi:hypothetical protein
LKLRAPEEFKAYKEKASIDLAPADVYMAGNIMYYVLTHQWLFQGMSSADASVAIKKGKRSDIPSSIKKSSDPYTRLLVEGIEMCWTHDPRKRLSARAVADYMKKQLAAIEGVEDMGVIKVEMPPLPSDHRYTDSDFYSNFK